MALRIYQTKWFARFARRERLAAASLVDAVARAERGLVDAELGGNVIKQRVARRGEGRSGGYRVLIAFRLRSRAVFLYGFAKSERDNIAPDELETLKEVAAAWLSADNAGLSRAVAKGILFEVKDES